MSVIEFNNSIIFNNEFKQIESIIEIFPKRKPKTQMALLVKSPKLLRKK